MLTPRIFGCSDPWHDSNYAYWDGHRLHHVEVERLTRKKYDVTSPLLVAASRDEDFLRNAEVLCIEEGYFLAPAVRQLLGGKDIDVDSFISKIMNTASSPSIRHQAIVGDPHVYTCLSEFLEKIKMRQVSISFFNHHFAHCANAFICSRLPEALCVSLDGGGSHLIGGQLTEVHGSVYRFNHLSILKDNPLDLITDWSPGWAWTRACKLLGLSSSEAGTVMAMAAYGQRDEEICALVRLDPFWHPNISEIDNRRAMDTTCLCRDLANLLEDEVKHYSFALELQLETERRIKKFLGSYLAQGKDLHLCLSGGSFLNCIVTGKVKEWFPDLEDVYIPPAPYDAGISVGLVQAKLSSFAVNEGPFGNHAIYPYANTIAYSALDVFAGCRAILRQDPEAKDFGQIAKYLLEGKIIGLFQGGSEIGRRALGNRSIVCDPRVEKHKDTINKIIKHRQWFRPFAPMIKAESVQEWFEVDANFSSPYMSFAVRFREDKGRLVPAVMHADGSARVQTVHKDLSPMLHSLLSSWEDISNIPILLNTSFNDREPIVETPTEAIATFAATGLDGLYFADHMLYVTRGQIQ